MQRHKGIILTGALSGLVIISLLMAALGNIAAVNDQSTVVPQEVPQEVQQIEQTTNLNNDEALQAWQQYSAELEQAVMIMQNRENTFQTQIQMANQTILQLQEQLNAANRSSVNTLGFTDDEGFEHDDG